ncbi:unnamed protein product [Sphagnum balticum]
MPGIPDPSYFLMLQSNGELDIYNFQNDTPKSYSTVVSVNALDPSASPPLFNASLATTPTLIKTLSTTSHQTKQEFFNGIELLSMVHHKYLVSLVGYCLDRKHLMLVYEYMSGGDLRRRLHGDGVSRRTLSWKQRTRTILQVAQGTLYTSPNPIISRLLRILI